MKNSSVRNLLLTLIFFVSSASVFGQKFEPKRRRLEPDTSISSTITSRTYPLYISFPNGYSNKDTIKYPVLYVLDGYANFPFYNSTIGPIQYEQGLEKVIIVCIGTGPNPALMLVDRNYDYTISEDTLDDRKSEFELGIKPGTMRSGGAEKFFKCITEEIIPFVDKHYKTTTDRGITGHSLAGLFTAYCLLNSKGVFSRYGINSPSLWWNHDRLLDQAASLLHKKKTWETSPVRVFMSVGENEGADMVPKMLRLSKMLEAGGDKNIFLTTHVFEDETHLSVIPANISRTLSALYKFGNGLLADTIGAVLKHKGITRAIKLYKTLKASKPQWYIFDESVLNTLGYQAMGKKLSEAISIFKLNTEEYPSSWNVFDSLGEAYLANGDNKDALENYQKSVNLNPSNKNGIDAVKKLTRQ